MRSFRFFSRPSKSDTEPTRNPRIYQPLDLNKQQIRLLHLERNLNGNGQMCCTLRTVDLANAPAYTALSYRWGELTPTHDNFVNDCQLEIRDNLYNFLNEYRKLDDNDPSSQFLWIDQISIEQTNTRERNHQVRLMSKIYAGADRVLIWLGSRNDRWGQSEVTFYEVAREFRKNPYKEVVRDLLENPYFDRLWIVQEILLARRLAVLLGDEWMSWETMQTCISSDDDGVEGHDGIDNKRKHARFLFQASQNSDRAPPELSLLYCINSFSSMTCFDPRDKVYAMLGMIAGEPIEIDYSKPSEQVLLEVVGVLLKPRFEAILMSDSGNLGSHDGEHAADTVMLLAANIGLPKDQRSALRRFLIALLFDVSATPIMDLGQFKTIQIGIHRGMSADGKDIWWFKLLGNTRLFFVQRAAADSELQRIRIPSMPMDVADKRLSQTRRLKLRPRPKFQIWSDSDVRKDRFYYPVRIEINGKELQAQWNARIEARYERENSSARPGVG